MTCIEKYGSNSFIETEEFKEKSKNTKLRLYGDEHFNNR